MCLRPGIQTEMVGETLTRQCLADVFAGQTEVTFADGKQTLWLDYLPSPVLALTASTTFCAAATQDGSVNVYSHTGRRFVVRERGCVSINIVWQINGDSELWFTLRHDTRMQVSVDDTHSFWSAQLDVGRTTPFVALVLILCT